MPGKTDCGRASDVSAEESTRQLLESIVLRALGLDEDFLHVWSKTWLAPVASRRSLGELRLVDAGRLEKRSSGGALEARIVPFGKIVVSARHLAFSVVPQKCL